MGKYPVTNQEYGLFMEAGGYEEKNWWCEEGWNWKISKQVTEPVYWSNPRLKGANQPVVGVSWYEASAYCRWLTIFYKEHPPGWFEGGSYKAQLPTEAQWEYAARGKAGRTYPWGDISPNSELANYKHQLFGTSAVGIYNKGNTPEGLHDMAGNVDEWCRDVWKGDVYQSRKEAVVDPLNEDDHSAMRSLRGGSWFGGSVFLPSAYRGGDRSGDRFYWAGFRVCLYSVPVEHVFGC